MSLQHHSKKIVVAGMKIIKIKQFRSCRLQYDASKRKTSHIFLIIILISELNTEKNAWSIALSFSKKELSAKN